ncbi:MAG: hypothetical protein ABEK84_07465, partial [Salinibacter sp.]
AQTRDLVIQKRERDLVIGTFGRAAYVIDDIQPFRAMAQQGTDLLADTMHVYKAPTAYLMTQGGPVGAHTSGSTIFEGENEPYGAMLTYSVAKPDTSTVDNPSKEVTIRITNAKGDTIRTFDGPAKDGINRTTWDLRRKGVRGPETTKEEAEEEEGQPVGPQVTPGTYTAHISYRGHTDSTMVVVRPDPRIEGVTEAEREARQALYQRLQSRIKTATKAADRIRKAKRTIDHVNKVLEGQEDSTAAAVREKGAAMKDSLNTLLHQIIPKDYEGIREDPTLVNARLGQVGYYLSTEREGPTETDRIALERAEERLRIALDKINAFFEQEWPGYKQVVRKAEPSFFEDYEPIQIGGNE